MHYASQAGHSHDEGIRLAIVLTLKEICNVRGESQDAGRLDASQQCRPARKPRGTAAERRGAGRARPIDGPAPPGPRAAAPRGRPWSSVEGGAAARTAARDGSDVRGEARSDIRGEARSTGRLDVR